MKAKKFIYVVVLQNAVNERLTLVYIGTFDEVVKRSKAGCPSGYFIREIRIA